MFRALLLALVASIALSSSALAGGSNGGTKKNATIKITNDLSTAQAVIIDASAATISRIQTAADQLAELTASGGKLIDPGKNASFAVKAGTHVITFASVTTSGISTPDTFTTTVAKGKTVSYNISAL